MGRVLTAGRAPSKAPEALGIGRPGEPVRWAQPGTARLPLPEHSPLDVPADAELAAAAPISPILRTH